MAEATGWNEEIASYTGQPTFIHTVLLRILGILVTSRSDRSALLLEEPITIVDANQKVDGAP